MKTKANRYLKELEKKKRSERKYFLARLLMNIFVSMITHSRKDNYRKWSVIIKIRIYAVMKDISYCKAILMRVLSRYCPSYRTVTKQ